MTQGDLAIVLHSHMPYVEGFGTFPFGEEWLFDAMASSYLPLLDIAHSLTMTVTPVLADQLEADGVAERARRFIEDHRLRPALEEARDCEPEVSRAADAETARYRRTLELLDDCDGDLLARFRQAQSDRGVALMASSATHAVLPLIATREGRRLQIETGIRSHRRRFGDPAGFWLPECAYEPGLEKLLAESGVSFFCVDQSAYEPGLDALAPVATAAGPVAFPIDWETISLVWSASGYPSDPGHSDFHWKSLRGVRVWAIADGVAYDDAAAADRARAQADEFLNRVAAKLADFRAERDRAGLVVFAIDTELLGHWWLEGPIWLEAVLAAAPEHGIELVTLPQAIERHEPVERPMQPSTWGERKDLSTWDSPEVADMAWAARRLELRLLRAVGEGRLRNGAAERAARELLAVQSSDWAFLDQRGKAGDYPYWRTVRHSEAMLEALEAGEVDNPRVRNLAPDISINTLAEP